MTLRTSRPGVVDLTVTHPLRQEQLLVYAGRPTCSVGLHGRPLPPVRLERLPSVGSGWARLEHATVVKVTHGASPLDLSLDRCSPGH